MSQLKVYYMEEEGSILSSSPESEIKAGMHKLLEYLKSKYNVTYEKVRENASINYNYNNRYNRKVPNK